MFKEIAQTTSLPDRTQHARQCVAVLKLRIPALIDAEDNRASAAYAGWPDRLFVVGVDGKVAMMGKPGPWGFKPNEVENWLKSNTPGH